MANNVSSLSFNGQNQYVKVNPATTMQGLDAVTFMARFKAGNNTLPFKSAFLEKQGSGDISGKRFRFRFSPTNGKLTFGFAPKDGQNETAYTYKYNWDDRWHHAAFVAGLTGAEPSYSIILDGVLVAEGTLIIPSGTTAVSATVSRGVYLGNADTSEAGVFPEFTAWEGKIDEIMIFKNMVNAGDISSYLADRDIWERDAAHEDLDLLSYYNLDEGSGIYINNNAMSFNPQGTLYNGGSTSMWTIDRPFVGNGTIDTTNPSTMISYAQTNLTADGFSASWATATDNVYVQYYELQVAPVADFSSFNAFNVGKSLSYEVTSLLPSTNYWWRIHAFDAVGNAGGFSATRSLSTVTIGDVTPPKPPTSLSASDVEHYIARINYTPSVSVDAIGYKVDVATDLLFKYYLQNYRNKDIGLDSFAIIDGLKPLKSYYIRMRSYDASFNDSVSSSTIRINTPRQPDITPPLPAILREAEGISSTTAILRWEEGIDNIGIQEYRLDVSQSSTFSGFVTTKTMNWQDVNVGNVLEYRVDGLEPSTNYYYRVRAVDDANNIAPNIVPSSENDNQSGVHFRTLQPSVFEGSYLEAEEYSIEAKSTTVSNPTYLEISPTLYGRLLYSLTTSAGSLVSAILKFRVRDYTSLGAINIRAMASSDIDVAAPPTPVINYTITNASSYHEIDITSLMTAGATSYVVRIGGVAFVGRIDMGVGTEEDTTAPTIQTMFDSMSATRPLPFISEVINLERRNLCKNPSVETNFLDYGLDVGVTYGRVSSNNTRGSYGAQITGSGANKGFFTHGSTSSSMPEVLGGQRISASFEMKNETSVMRGVRITLEGFNESNVATTIFSTKDVYVTGSWWRYSITGLVPLGTTRFRTRVATIDGLAFTFHLDNFFEEAYTSEYSSYNFQGAPFDGSTQDAQWLGDTNNSVSIYNQPTIMLGAPYVGDSDENNTMSSIIMTKNERGITNGQIEPAYSASTNRTLKRKNFIFAPSQAGYNVIRNPSFEFSSTFWSGGDLSTSRAAVGNNSYYVDSLGVANYTNYLSFPPLTSYVIHAKVLPQPNVQVKIQVAHYNQAQVFSHFTESTTVLGNGKDWLTLSLVVPSTANSYAQGLKFIGINGTKQFFIDAVQASFGNSLANRPYRDGSMIDSLWEGDEHVSPTSFSMENNKNYVFRVIYTDPQGFFDESGVTTAYRGEYFKTPIPPDNAFYATYINLTSEKNEIRVEVPYEGDDNETATARIEFRRNDLTTWNEVRPLYLRNEKKIKGIITNLKQGTNYEVRVIVTDEVDAVNGTLSGVISDSITTSFTDNNVKANPLITFGGFTLTGRRDKKVAVTSHNAFGFPERHIDIRDLPRLDGAVEMQTLWGRKTINMSGIISGDSRTELEEVRTALAKALSKRQQPLVIDSLSRSGRYYNATCEQLSIEEEGKSNIIHLEWSARFVCADPFAYDILEEEIPSFLASNGSEVSMNNKGDALVTPYFLLTTKSAYSTRVVITNTITGEQLQPLATIISGDRIIVDGERRSLVKNGVEIDYTGSFPQLTVGGNTIQFTLTSSKAPSWYVPTISAEIRWRTKYL